MWTGKAKARVSSWDFFQGYHANLKSLLIPSSLLSRQRAPKHQRMFNDV